jgi:ribosome-associated protein
LESERSLEVLVSAITAAAHARKAEEIVALDLSKICSYCDVFIICNGTSRRHVAAIAEGILEDMRTRGLRPLGVEGTEAQRWILVDFGDIIVHVFDPAMRGFYDLEGIWTDAKKIKLNLPEDPPAVQPLA